MKISLIIPTYNAEKEIHSLLAGIQAQSLQPSTLLIIDSSSTDKTPHLIKKYASIKLHTIPQSTFNHSGTRRLGVELAPADFYIFMTQDAIPANPDTFKNIIHTLTSEKNIACAYGRQLPKQNAKPLEAHARLFNYPDKSYIRSIDDASQYGIKTCFNSNSFAAYQHDALMSVGNFPSHLVTGEDTYIAGKLLQNGFRIAYAANAMVYHSHDFTLAQELKRYATIGCLHQSQAALFKSFGKSEKEGKRFVMSELRYLVRQHHYRLIPRALLSTLVKYTGYQVGRHQSSLPMFISKWLGCL